MRQTPNSLRHLSTERTGSVTSSPLSASPSAISFSSEFVITVPLSASLAARVLPGLKEVKTLKKLISINLSKTRIVTANLESLSNFTNLNDLQLAETWIADAGLDHLKGLTNLQSLNLEGTLISDAGLMHLARLSKLQSVNAARTKVTRAGEGRLRKERPNLFVAVRDEPTGR